MSCTLCIQIVYHNRISTTPPIIITESYWNLAGGHKLELLSVQQTVSCDTVDLGCNGGDTPT